MSQTLSSRLAAAVTQLELQPIPAIQQLGNMTQSLAVVERLRAARMSDAALAQHTHALKRWQSGRFRSTYADLLQTTATAPAANFFLSELYCEQEFARRDAQFARIAGTIERVFPKNVVQTATLLAQLHALSETLDAGMARLWQQLGEEDTAQELDLSLYQQLWQALLAVPGCSEGRQAQIDSTHQLGRQLQRHTAVPGLRLMLKMMRGPASAAGLHQLQQFLERGFDTFAQLGRASQVDHFLSTIVTRETDWLVRMSS